MYLCRESRRQVIRKVRVTAETPRTLWCRAADPNASDICGVGGGGNKKDSETRLGETVGKKTAASVAPTCPLSGGRVGSLGDAGSESSSLGGAQKGPTPSGSGGAGDVGGDINISSKRLRDVIESYVTRNNRGDVEYLPGGECGLGGVERLLRPRQGIEMRQPANAGEWLKYRPSSLLAYERMAIATAKGRTMYSAPCAPSRVPLARVEGVIWALTAKELIALGFCWPDGVKELQFWGKFDDPLERIPFPETLEVLSFGYRFNRSLEPGCVRWPPKLKRLTLGAKWNRQLRGAGESWPASLEVLCFGSCFDQPLTGKGIGLPQGLLEVSLGGTFNQPLVGVDWPPPLRKLTLSDNFNQSLDGVKFPKGLREITLRGVFNKDIGGVLWPEGLRILRFGAQFNRPLFSPDDFYVADGEGGSAPVGARNPLPAGLKELYVGDAFSQPISRAELPDGLEVLVIGKSFEYAASAAWPSELLRLHLLCRWGGSRGDAVEVGEAFGDGGVGGARNRPRTELPGKLEFLEVGDHFNSSLTTVAWPPTLKVLLLGASFNRPIGRREGGAALLPDGLVELRLSKQFDRALENVRLPLGLKRLVMNESCRFDHALDNVSWPPGLEELKLGNWFNRPLEGCVFPETLRVLELGWCFEYPLQGVALPDGLRHLSVSAHYSKSHIRRLHWPRSLKTLYMGSLRFSSREALAKWAERNARPLF